MKPNELRIRNLMLFENKVLEAATIGTDFCMLSDGADTYDAWYDEMQSIPLTEELLLKCGFEKSQIDLRSAYSPRAYVGLQFENGEFRHYKESNEWCYRATRIDNPIFLHQLQNLYFALTGEELKIELL